MPYNHYRQIVYCDKVQCHKSQCLLDVSMYVAFYRVDVSIGMTEMGLLSQKY